MQKTLYADSLESCSYFSGDYWTLYSRLQSARKSGKNPKHMVNLDMLLDVCATMMMTPRHLQKTHLKRVKAPALPEACKKGKILILHSRSQTPPKNGCFTVRLQYNIQWIGTTVTLPKSHACGETV
jgi:hypothetical protein